jgi:hypothetical protein
MKSSSSPQVISVFISSPMDVPQERLAVKGVCQELISEPLLGGKVIVHPILWEVPGTGAPLLATCTPQQAINEVMCQPSECDLVIVILASRLGTPLPREANGQALLKPNGKPYRSGTEWEFLDAVRDHKEYSLPEVLVYRKTPQAPLSPTDPEFAANDRQRRLVDDFFSEFLNSDGSMPRGFATYTAPDDLAGLVKYAVMRLLPGILEKRKLERGPGGRVVGQCPSCKHIHADWQKRTACEFCKATLREPCTKCGTRNGVWSKFCGVCHIDLETGLNEVRKEAAGWQKEINRLEQTDQNEAALARLKALRVPGHSGLEAVREGFRRQTDRLQAALEERGQKHRRQAVQEQGTQFDDLARRAQWREAAIVLARLRRLKPDDRRLIKFGAALASGLRELVRAEPDDRELRRLYLKERRAAPELEAEDECSGQRLTTILTWTAVPGCVVLFPLLVFLPTLLGTIRGLQAARRCREYGPLPLRALFLSEQELQRRYRPGGPVGPYESGFSPLKM